MLRLASNTPDCLLNHVLGCLVGSTWQPLYAVATPLHLLVWYCLQVYSADEAFVTGTFAGVLPVVEVDGRVIGEGTRGPLTEQLQQLYLAMLDEQAAAGREPAQ